MPLPSPALACLSGLLAARLEIHLVARRRYAKGEGIAESVVSSYRMIVLLRGAIDYHLEDAVQRIGPDSLLLVPAWMKRGWTASRPVEMAWAEFTPERETIFPADLILAHGAASAADTDAMERTGAIWNDGRCGEQARLAIEGEIKAILGRLALTCESTAAKSASASDAQHGDPGSTLPPASAVAREVAAVAGLIEHHYASPDVLDIAMKEVRSSPAYFRTQFRLRTGFTLGRYAAMVRFRRARSLLSTTSLPVAEIGSRSGFRDPLHFSRSYRQFWGHPPTDDRRR